MHFPVSGITGNALSFAACRNGAGLGAELVPGLSKEKLRFFVAASSGWRWACACCWSRIFRPWLMTRGSMPTSPQNWLQHGVYGITNSGVITPTLSRLPGYPAFLAVIFKLFGSRQLSRSPAGAGAVRLGDLLPDCRPGPAPLFSDGRHRRHFCWPRSVHFWRTMPQRLLPRRWRFSSPRWLSIWRFADWESASSESSKTQNAVGPRAMARLRPFGGCSDFASA